MFTHSKHKTNNNLFNKLVAVAADASLGLQICGPMPDSFYNENVHYKMEGVNYGEVSKVVSSLLLSICAVLITIVAK